MKYLDEFRDPVLARGLAAAIASEVRPGRRYRLMEFCGGHTHAIARYGLADLLPEAVALIHGPGCPVCVLPVGRIDDALSLARRPGVILACYGDVMRVPGSGGLSLLKLRGEGADVRMVTSTLDAVALAATHPERELVFFAIGFETTTPPTAVALRQARARGLGNFSVFCNHVLTPAAIAAILADPEPGGAALDGLIGPAHVSTVIGSRPYEACAARWGKPVVIAGFEPLDLLQAILMLVRQLNDGRAEVETQFSRAVHRDGNPKAQALVAEMFETRDSFEWRGLGSLPASALRLRESWADFDAERKFGVPGRAVPDHPGCACAAILRGRMRPQECRLFATACTPETPVGSCMVSAEGACAAIYGSRRFRP